MDLYRLDAGEVRDLAGDALGDDGRLRILPAAYWAETTAAERNLFGNRHGLYSFPTEELVEYLRDAIEGRSAIEIGAGHGVLAQALGIPATDNYQQVKSPYREVYKAGGWAVAPYGPNVEELDAYQAVRKYRPKVVIGCWVTHKYDPKRHYAGGNEIGIDEADLLNRAETYIFVGNEKVHRGKAIWDRPNKVEYPDFVYSRAGNGSRDFIARWGQA